MKDELKILVEAYDKILNELLNMEYDEAIKKAEEYDKITDYRFLFTEAIDI